MIMQSQPLLPEERELKILQSQNEALFKSRAQALMTRANALMGYSTEVSLLESTSLPQATRFISSLLERQKQSQRWMPEQEQQQIDREIQEELTKEIQILDDQIQMISKENLNLRNQKNKYLTAQKYIIDQIVKVEGSILQTTLKVTNDNKTITSESLNPALSFTFEQTPDGQIRFRKDFKDLLSHYETRLLENKKTLKKLQQNLFESIKQFQKINTRIQFLQKSKQNTVESVKRTDEIKQKIKERKQTLSQLFKKKYEQVQKKLPDQIDKGVKQFIYQNTAYENAYQKLIQIIKSISNNYTTCNVTI